MAGSVVTAGLVPPGPSGMRDHGHLLSDELRRRGWDGRELWMEHDGRRLWPAVAASLALLRRAWALPPETVVLWHYSPFAYACRGIPLPGVLLGLLLRSRRVPVVTVLHELAYPWGRRRRGGRLLAVTQHVALWAVLAGSSAAIVTTDRRAGLPGVPRALSARVPVTVVPVFSTMGEGSPAPPEEGVARLGVVGHGSDGARSELLLAAFGHMAPARDLRVVLLGAPGPGSPRGQRWARLAAAAGLEDHLEFTGVLPLAELSGQVAACEVIVLLDEEGPSSRRTMLAAALAHGRPVVATDGPNRWEGPIREGVVTVVQPDAAELAAEVRRLLHDAGARAAMSARASAFYQREMSLARAGEAVSAVLATVRPPVRRSGSRRTRSC